jgi:hypothetical protein
MLITYRRTGGALGLMAVALAVTIFTVAAAAVAVITAVVLAPVALLARAMWPSSRRHRRASTSPWPHETIDAEVVSTTRSSDERDLLRLDSDKG